MAQYKIEKPVEIAGEVRKVGDVLDESLFSPALPEEQQRKLTEDEAPHLSEIDSLLKTGHIKLAQ